jgi:hypothetical protein
MNNLNLQSSIDYLLSIESVYILLLVILNIVNLCMFYNNKNLILFNGIILFIVYFLVSKREDKKILLLAVIHFAIWGVIIESFIINKSKNTLYYKDPTPPFNVPLWLIPIYALFCITALYTYNIFKILLSK